MQFLLVCDQVEEFTGPVSLNAITVCMKSDAREVCCACLKMYAVSGFMTRVDGVVAAACEENPQQDKSALSHGSSLGVSYHDLR